MLGCGQFSECRERHLGNVLPSSWERGWKLAGLVQPFGAGACFLFMQVPLGGRNAILAPFPNGGGKASQGRDFFLLKSDRQGNSQ